MGFNTTADDQRTDVDINLTTNVANSTVKIGVREWPSPYTATPGSSVGIGNASNNKVKNVNLKAHGQKDFKVKEIYASGDVNVDVKGDGLAATAVIGVQPDSGQGKISGKNVTIKAENLKNIDIKGVDAPDGDINITPEPSEDRYDYGQKRNRGYIKFARKFCKQQ